MEPTKEVVSPPRGELQLEQQEVKLRNGESVTFESFRINRMRLFHGSRVHGIQEFNDADETTIGDGVYLTSNKEAAYGYSIVRSVTKDDQPSIYEVEISNLNILNLTTKSGVDAFAKRFREKLFDYLRSVKIDHEKIMDKDRNEMHKNLGKLRVMDLIEEIDKQSYARGLKNITFGVGHFVREMLGEMGYDGLLALEGGEGGNGVLVGDHDSYVIFDPTKVTIVEQQQFASRIDPK